MVTGGCGACVVLLSKYDPISEELEHFTVSSCLTLLCSVDRCSITTSEGLGNSRDGFHPIHQRFSGFHASQCGFCTPGMCVSLFSALINAEKTPRVEPPPGFSKLTVSEAEKAISGNLCRCTGYRPIADVCKSFAADVDMEDLGINSFWEKGDCKEVKVSKLPFYNPSDGICTFPEFLKNEIRSSVLCNSKRYSWYNPVSVKELQSMLISNSNENNTRVKLVVGNTGVGYYKEIEHYDKFVNLRYIPELSVIRRDHLGIEIGATVTISKAILALKKEKDFEFHPHAEAVFQRIADHMEKIASGFIRNSASVGGNLVMAQRNHFPSDIATILLAAGSSVNIMTDLIHERLTLEEFLGRPPLDSRSVLLSVHIPCWEKARNGFTKTDAKLLFETYRAAPRPLGNSLPYLNAAFLAEVTPCETSSGVIIDNIQLAFGAYGIKHATRARMVEDFLAGKLLSVNVLFEAIKLLGATIVPKVGTTSAAYRSSLAVGFLFEFLHSLLDGCNSHKQFGRIENAALSLSGKQVVESNLTNYPVGVPIIKAGAAIQASGLFCPPF